MNIQPIQEADLELIKQLQPLEWDDITIPHKLYLRSQFCSPIKVTINDRIAGIGTAIRHLDTVWLAHIIVHPDFRSKGIGKTITQTLVDSIDRRQFKTIYLIATDLGFPVYQKVGFKEEADYAHLTRKNGTFPVPVLPSIVTYKKKYQKEIIELDKRISGEDRRERLRDQLETSMLYISGNKVEGAYFPQLGNGLIIAENPAAGIELMKLRIEERDFAILPAENKPGINFLLENNFNQVRISKRMFLGKRRKWHPAFIYNRISGQFG
ncbi:MAG: GNAT family N-acetyltransferase [Ferruginibacter sp.]